MLTRRSQNMAGEEGVLMSLAISLGMIILTAVGLWMWKVLARIAEAMFILPPSEMP